MKRKKRLPVMSKKAKAQSQMTLEEIIAKHGPNIQLRDAIPDFTKWIDKAFESMKQQSGTKRPSSTI